MTLVFRDVKNAALTTDELDNNFRHLVNSHAISGSLTLIEETSEGTVTSTLNAQNLQALIGLVNSTTEAEKRLLEQGDVIRASAYDTNSGTSTPSTGPQWGLLPNYNKPSLSGFFQNSTLILPQSSVQNRWHYPLNMDEAGLQFGSPRNIVRFHNNQRTGFYLKSSFKPERFDYTVTQHAGTYEFLDLGYDSAISASLNANNDVFKPYDLLQKSNKALKIEPSVNDTFDFIGNNPASVTGPGLLFFSEHTVLNHSVASTLMNTSASAKIIWNRKAQRDRGLDNGNLIFTVGGIEPNNNQIGLTINTLGGGDDDSLPYSHIYGSLKLQHPYSEGATNTLGWDENTQKIVKLPLKATGSNSNGIDDDWYIDIFDNIVTSSRSVVITGSLSHGVNTSVTDWGPGTNELENGGFFGGVSYSHVEGINTLTTGRLSSGYGAHAEGHLTTASGYASHAEGKQTFTFGSSSHAEGLKTKALNTLSHAEGMESMAGRIAFVPSKIQAVNTPNMGPYDIYFEVGPGEKTEALNYLKDRGIVSGSHTITLWRGNSWTAFDESATAFGSGQDSYCIGTFPIVEIEAGSNAIIAGTSQIYSHIRIRIDRDDNTSGFPFATATDNWRNPMLLNDDYSKAPVGFQEGNYGQLNLFPYVYNNNGWWNGSPGIYTFGDDFPYNEQNSGHLPPFVDLTRYIFLTFEGLDNDFSRTYELNSSPRNIQPLANGGFGSNPNYDPAPHSSSFNPFYLQECSVNAPSTTVPGVVSRNAFKPMRTGLIGSHAAGYRSKAEGPFSYAQGVENIARGVNTFTVGIRNVVWGDNGVVFGKNNFTNESTQGNFIAGANNYAAGTDRSIVFGSKNTGSASVANTILGGASNKISYTAHSLIIGQKNNISHFAVYASGYRNINSIIAGAGNKVLSDSSTRTRNNLILGFSSSLTTSENSLLAGSHNTIYKVKNATLFGSGNIAINNDPSNFYDNTNNQTVVGTFNASDNSNNYLLIVGNGNNSGDRSNLAEFHKDKIILDTGSLPTSDPNNVGQLWRDGTDLKISLG